MTKSSKKKTATKKKITGKLHLMYKYMGAHDTVKIWDGQTVSNGEAFLPKDKACAACCEESPLFEVA